MKCLVAIGLLVTLTSVVCEEAPVEAAPVAVATRPRPIGVIYLIQLVNQPPPPSNEYDEIANTVPSDNPYKNSKLLLALSPNSYEEEKGNDREKRSPGGYGKGGYGGGGGCNVCGGGGGGYPGGGGYGGGKGGGGGGAWATSSSQSSAGSFGYGGGKGYGK